jgi:hypothetical protein
MIINRIFFDYESFVLRRNFVSLTEPRLRLPKLKFYCNFFLSLSLSRSSWRRFYQTSVWYNTIPNNIMANEKESSSIIDFHELNEFNDLIKKISFITQKATRPSNHVRYNSIKRNFHHMKTRELEFLKYFLVLKNV